MISGSAAAGMLVTALAMVLIPGPNMMYLVSRSVAYGRTAGLVSLCGTLMGFGIYLVVANLGLAVVFLAVPWLFVALKACGAIYIAYLAWQALTCSDTLDPVGAAPASSAAKLFGMGLITNVLNPKTALIYLALIPQFVDPARGHPTAQGFVLGGLQIGVSAVVHLVIVAGAASFTSFLRARPAWARWQQRLAGCLLGAIAVLLAREVPARVRA
jgi:threonine/homoserine/homoserine lactone efflux protein